MIAAIASLVLLHLSQAGGQNPNPETFTFAGQPVTLSFPQPGADATPSTDVAGWAGWSGLAGSMPVFDDVYASPRDWSSIAAAYRTAPSKAPVVWRTKIFILANLDTMDRMADGSLHARRSTLSGPNFSETFAGIAQLVAGVYALSHGRVLVKPDVVIDPQPTRDVDTPDVPAFGPGFITDYLAPRVNGGLYEADDKIYRGPYQSILVIDPEARYDAPLLDPSSRFDASVISVNGMPTAEVPYFAVGGGAMPGLYPLALIDTWAKLASARFTEKALPPIDGTLDRDDWAEAASFDAPPTDVLLPRLAALKNEPEKPVALPPGLDQRAYKTQNVTLSLVSDAQKGSVLSYLESEWARFGGFVLPHGDAAIDESKTPTLSFSVKSMSGDPIALTFTDTAHKSASVSLGRDRPVADATIPKAQELEFAADGAWHTISIDLKSLGLGQISEIRVGASPACACLHAVKPPVAYQFADFKLGQDPPTPTMKAPSPDAASADPEDRIAAAVALGKKGMPDSALTTLLKDPDEDVELNACAAFCSVKDPFVETRLGDLALDANPRISEMALEALNHQGTAAAKAFIERSLRSGLDFGREVAARIIASAKEPRSAAELSVLLSDQNWRVRLEGARAVGSLPGDIAQKVSLAFFAQVDPAIRFAVVQTADPKEDAVRRQLEWCAVNDPSDMVRAWSNFKLIQSPDAAVRAEGYKGVRDDSWWARIVLIDAMGLHPTDEEKPALKLALTDRNETVRAHAVSAIGALADVSVDDLQSVLDDRNPAVQLAILSVAKKRHLQLPAATLDAMRKSPDGRVVQEVGTSG